MLSKPSVVYLIAGNYYTALVGYSQSSNFPTFHYVQFRDLGGKVLERAFFMDDFGTLQPVFFSKLAVTFTGGY